MTRGKAPRKVGNPGLREARLRRGWSEEDVAVALHQLASDLGEPEPRVDRHQVSKWELGARNPGRYYRPRLCIVLQTTPKRLGFEPSPTLLRDIGELARRRVERQASAPVHAAPAVLPEASLAAVDRERLALTLQYLWPADAPLLDSLDRAADDLAARCEMEAPGAVLPALHRHLAVLQALLARSHPPALEARLRAVGSRAAELAGFSSFVGGLLPDAYTHYALAEVLGREAGRGDLVALALAAKSRMYSRTAQEFGDPARAIALLDAAELAAGPMAAPALRGWVYGRRAEEHAELEHDAESGRDIEQAFRVVQSAAGLNLFSDLDSAWLENYRGVRAMKLGRADEAIEVYEVILRTTDPRLFWERATALTHLATAWALKSDVERAAELLRRALELTTATGNARGLLLVQRVRERQLGRWRSGPQVGALDEALRAARHPG